MNCVVCQSRIKIYVHWMGKSHQNDDYFVVRNSCHKNRFVWDVIGSELCSFQRNDNENNYNYVELLLSMFVSLSIVCGIHIWEVSFSILLCCAVENVIHVIISLSKDLRGTSIIQMIKWMDDVFAKWRLMVEDRTHKTQCAPNQWKCSTNKRSHTQKCVQL